MITVAAAGVLATVIPIGLLIIGFEIRQVPSMVATGRAGTVMLWILGSLFLLGLVLGFVAEYALVRAVVMNMPVDPISTAFVTVGLMFVGLASFLLLFASLGAALGLHERLGRRVRGRVEGSPRRLARRIRYIDRHHPTV